MHDELIAYLLGGLDADDRRQVELDLEEQPELRTYLEILHQGLAPLEADDGDLDPPQGLALRTCRYLWKRVNINTTEIHPGGSLFEP